MPFGLLLLLHLEQPGRGLLGRVGLATPAAPAIRAWAHAASPPVLGALLVRSPKTISRWAAENRGLQVVSTICDFVLPFDPRTLSSTSTAVGATTWRCDTL